MNKLPEVKVPEKFEDTKLLDTPLVRRAFDHLLSRAVFQGDLNRRMNMRGLNEQITALINQTRSNENMPKEDREKRAEDIEKNRENIIKENMDAVDRAAENTYNSVIMRKTSVGNLFSGVKGKDNDVIVAASLLADLVNSPMDFMDVRNKVGEDVADLIAELTQPLVYPDYAEEMRKNASDGAKVFMLLEEAVAFQSLRAQAEFMDPEAEIKINLDILLKGFENSKTFFGVDEYADQVYIEAFNNAQKQLGTDLKLERNDQGEVEVTGNGARSGIHVYVSDKAPNKKKNADIDPSGKLKGGRKLF